MTSFKDQIKQRICLKGFTFTRFHVFLSGMTDVNEQCCYNLACLHFVFLCRCSLTCNFPINELQKSGGQWICVAGNLYKTHQTDITLTLLIQPVESFFIYLLQYYFKNQRTSRGRNTYCTTDAACCTV